jgi:hypothetical protein
MSSMTGTMAAEQPLLDLEAMAAIVRELVSGGQARRQDEQWLRTQAEEAGLGQHAVSALEALRQKLCRGTALLADGGVVSWG